MKQLFHVCILVGVVSAASPVDAQDITAVYGDVLFDETDAEEVVMWAIGSGEDIGCNGTVHINPYVVRVNPSIELITETTDSDECYVFAISPAYTIAGDQFVDGDYRGINYVEGGWQTGCGVVELWASIITANYTFSHTSGGGAWYHRCPGPSVCTQIYVRPSKVAPVEPPPWPAYLNLRVLAVHVGFSPGSYVRECLAVGAVVVGGC